jgi:MFS family permease
VARFAQFFTNKTGRWSLNVWPFLLLVAAMLFVFPAVERRASDPVLRLKLFGSRQAVLASILSAGAGLREVGMVFMPALAVAAMPGIITSKSASYLLMPVVLAMAVGSPMVGCILDKVGSKVVVMVGAALLALGMLMLSSSSVTSVLGLFILAGVVIGLGLSALLGALVRYIMLNEAPGSDRAAAQGAITLFPASGSCSAARWWTR